VTSFPYQASVLRDAANVLSGDMWYDYIAHLLPVVNQLIYPPFDEMLGSKYAHTLFVLSIYDKRKTIINFNHAVLMTHREATPTTQLTVTIFYCTLLRALVVSAWSRVCDLVYSRMPI